MFTPLRRTDPDYFEFEWVNVLVVDWQPGTPYVEGQYVRPTVPNGCFMECTADGWSGSIEPAWGTVAVEQADGAGSLRWTPRDTVSADSISAVTYTITPSGITQSDPTETGTRTRVKLDASAASLGTYKVVAEITAGGEDHSQEAYLDVVD